MKRFLSNFAFSLVMLTAFAIAAVLFILAGKISGWFLIPAFVYGAGLIAFLMASADSARREGR